MKQIDSITIVELTEMSKSMYDGLVKAVVDVRQHAVVVDAEMHYDEEQYLLEHGSKQYDLWGINLYPAEYGTANFIEYDSMINIRSTQGNKSRSVEDTAIQAQITDIISEVVHE